MLADVRKNRDFYLYATAIMLPVIAQQLISALFNFADNFMVGLLGAASLAGVSVANKPYTVFLCLLFGFTGAGGILIAQYYGARERRTMQQLFGLQVMGGLAIGVIFFLALHFFPRQIMGAFVTDPQTMRAGLDYLSVIKWSYIPTGVSLACMHALRALGRNRMPMVAGFVTMLVNIALNSLLIFGLLGFPRLEERGAALATLIARLVEMGFYLYVLERQKTPFTRDVGSFRHLPRRVLATFVRKGVPLTANEVLWTGGQMIFFWTYAHVQEYALPAISLLDQTTTLIYVLTAGMSSAASAIIGQTLGAGDIARAKEQARRLLRLASMLGAACLVLGGALAFIVPAAYGTLNADLRVMATQMILVQAVLVIANALYMTTFSVLRAGGDTRSAVMLDSGYMWVVVVPAALLCAFVLPAVGRPDVRIAFVVVQVLMNAKIFWALAVLRRGRWANNMTRKN